MTIGELIKLRRTQLGLTMKELGDRIGVANPLIAKWERATNSDSMQISTIKKMATALEMDASYLLYPETIIDIVLSALRDICVQDDSFCTLVDNAIVDYSKKHVDMWISHYINDYELHENMYLHLSNYYTPTFAKLEEREFIDLFQWIFCNYRFIEQRVCAIIKNGSAYSSTIASNSVNSQDKQLAENTITSILHYVSFFSFVYGDIIKILPRLNNMGQEKATEMIELIAKIPEYQEKNTEDMDEAVKVILSVDEILFPKNNDNADGASKSGGTE